MQDTSRPLALADRVRVTLSATGKLKVLPIKMGWPGPIGPVIEHSWDKPGAIPENDQPNTSCLGLPLQCNFC